MAREASAFPGLSAEQLNREALRAMGGLAVGPAMSEEVKRAYESIGTAGIAKQIQSFDTARLAREAGMFSDLSTRQLNQEALRAIRGLAIKPALNGEALRAIRDIGTASFAPGITGLDTAIPTQKLGALPSLSTDQLHQKALLAMEGLAIKPGLSDEALRTLGTIDTSSFAKQLQGLRGTYLGREAMRAFSELAADAISPSPPITETDDHSAVSTAEFLRWLVALSPLTLLGFLISLSGLSLNFATELDALGVVDLSASLVTPSLSLGLTMLGIVIQVTQTRRRS